MDIYLSYLLEVESWFGFHPFFFPSGFMFFWEVYLLQRSCLAELRMISASQQSTDPRHQARQDIQVPLSFQLPQSSWMIALAE
jgi:hypothetical protein